MSDPHRINSRGWDDLRAAAWLALIVAALCCSAALIASALHSAQRARSLTEDRPVPSASAAVSGSQAAGDPPEAALRRAMEEEDARAPRRLYGTTRRVSLRELPPTLGGMP